MGKRPDVIDRLRAACEIDRTANRAVMLAAIAEIERLREIEAGNVLAFGDDFGDPPEKLVPALQKKVRSLEAKNEKLAGKAWKYDQLCK